ncbi:hypothetical protein [Devosia lacusdianchii]|uniref:hypothetical protein n=1 Tax=Devosia lacusdianchii TaxID=2917991 RepID=UPI001F06A196|nr:hypothetical protein [Devosia sp. JXJ CY 41]
MVAAFGKHFGIARSPVGDDIAGRMKRLAQDDVISGVQRAQSPGARGFAAKSAQKQETPLTLFSACDDSAGFHLRELRYCEPVRFGAMGVVSRHGVLGTRPTPVCLACLSRAGVEPPGSVQILDDALFFPGWNDFPAGRFVMCKQILNASFFAAKLVGSNIAADRSDPANLNSRLLTSLSDISISLRPGQ